MREFARGPAQIVPHPAHDPPPRRRVQLRHREPQVAIAPLWTPAAAARCRARPRRTDCSPAPARARRSSAHGRPRPPLPRSGAAASPEHLVQHALHRRLVRATSAAPPSTSTCRPHSRRQPDGILGRRDRPRPSRAAAATRCRARAGVKRWWSGKRRDPGQLAARPRAPCRRTCPAGAMPQNANTRSPVQRSIRHQRRREHRQTRPSRPARRSGPARSARRPGSVPPRAATGSRKRPRRHDPAVAEPDRAVDDQQRCRLGQARVLQPVIHQQQPAPRPRPPRAPTPPDPPRPRSAPPPPAAAARRRPAPPRGAPDRPAARPRPGRHSHGVRQCTATPAAAQAAATRSSTTVVLPAPPDARVAAAQDRHRRGPARPRDSPAPSRRRQARTTGDSSTRQRRRPRCQKRRRPHRAEQVEQRAGDPVRQRALAARDAPRRLPHRASRAAGSRSMRSTQPRQRRPRRPPAPGHRPTAAGSTISAKLPVCGPTAMAAPNRAASSGFCPPRPTRLRPMNTMRRQPVEQAELAHRVDHPNPARRRILPQRTTGRSPSSAAMAAPRSGCRGAMIVSRPGCAARQPRDAPRRRSPPRPDACWPPARPGARRSGPQPRELRRVDRQRRRRQFQVARRRSARARPSCAQPLGIVGGLRMHPSNAPINLARKAAGPAASAA